MDFEREARLTASKLGYKLEQDVVDSLGVHWQWRLVNRRNGLALFYSNSLKQMMEFLETSAKAGAMG